jgi:phosphoglucosamine mutase
MLENALVSGIVAGGVNAECLGVVPTPVLAYSTISRNADVGVMITASHNPPQYNGIKIFNQEGIALSNESQQKIEEIINQDSFKLVNWQAIGKVFYNDDCSNYVRMIQDRVMLKQKWHVLVDPGCGATFQMAPVLFRRMGLDVTTINAQPDGFFPGRKPEPNIDSLKDLAETVRRLGADVGVAYDGDGDRVAFIDEEGCFTDFDQVLAAYSEYVVKKNPGSKIITNVETSMCVEKLVEKHNGKVLRTKVGDVHIAEALRRQNAIFGGEPCGAWIHPQYHLCPDGILSSILLLRALEEEDKKLSDFTSQVMKYPLLRENVRCSNKLKNLVIEKVRENLKTLFPSYKKMSSVDGVRLDVDEGWILIRVSGTEPFIRITVEAESLKNAEDLMKKGKDVVETFVGRVTR